jgi:UV DNA damage endonuclease
VNGVWSKKGIKVKQHLSEPRPGAVTVIEKRAHADRCHSLPEALPDDVDLMIEVGSSGVGHRVNDNILIAPAG